MSGSALVAYNPFDKEQRQFLSSLALGESGGDYSIGWGGTNLSGYPVDQYGFPKWSGKIGPDGISHAAGAYQFQPGTWAEVAADYGLNFQNNADQDAGAWYKAEQVYYNQTGRSLDADLDAGYLTKINSALKSTWTSVTKGNGLAANIAKGIGAELTPGATATSSTGGTGTPSVWSDPVGAVSTYFVRGGMILAGIAILVVALWALLRSDALKVTA